MVCVLGVRAMVVSVVVPHKHQKISHRCNDMPVKSGGQNHAGNTGSDRALLFPPPPTHKKQNLSHMSPGMFFPGGRWGVPIPMMGNPTIH